MPIGSGAFRSALSVRHKPGVTSWVSGFSWSANAPT